MRISCLLENSQPLKSRCTVTPSRILEDYWSRKSRSQLWIIWVACHALSTPLELRKMGYRLWPQPCSYWDLLVLLRVNVLLSSLWSYPVFSSLYLSSVLWHHTKFHSMMCVEVSYSCSTSTDCRLLLNSCVTSRLSTGPCLIYSTFSLVHVFSCCWQFPPFLSPLLSLFFGHLSVSPRASFRISDSTRVSICSTQNRTVGRWGALFDTFPVRCGAGLPPSFVHLDAGFEILSLPSFKVGLYTCNNRY